MTRTALNTDEIAAAVIAMERAALDRWGKGDPSGFLDLCAPDVVYFDPHVDHRIDGLAALTQYYETLRGKIHLDKDDVIDPLVQVHGDTAVLTFHNDSWADGKTVRWNCTEVYVRMNGSWKIVQTHWSYNSKQLTVDS